MHSKGYGTLLLLKLLLISIVLYLLQIKKILLYIKHDDFFGVLHSFVLGRVKWTKIWKTI